MAALERYFLAKGKFVAGYDRTPSDLTKALEDEGVHIDFDEDPALIPDECRDPQRTLVVYTPAVPEEKNRVGLSGLEPPTSRLSGVRSNRLSYKPLFFFDTFVSVEMERFELLTPCLQGRCSPN